MIHDPHPHQLVWILHKYVSFRQVKEKISTSICTRMGGGGWYCVPQTSGRARSTAVLKKKKSLVHLNVIPQTFTFFPNSRLPHSIILVIRASRLHKQTQVFIHKHKHFSPRASLSPASSCGDEGRRGCRRRAVSHRRPPHQEHARIDLI